MYVMRKWLYEMAIAVHKSKATEAKAVNTEATSTKKANQWLHKLKALKVELNKTWDMLAGKYHTLAPLETMHGIQW